MTVASRVAVMDTGMIVQVATPDQIYETPNSVYVADFIGEVNLIEGHAVVADGLAAISWAEGQSPITAKTDLQADTKCTFAVRPEKITITTDEPQDRTNKVKGAVLDIAYLGNISTYHVELPDGKVIKAQTSNNRRIARRSFTWEDTVWLSWTDTAGVVLIA